MDLPALREVLVQVVRLSLILIGGVYFLINSSFGSIFFVILALVLLYRP